MLFASGPPATLATDNPIGATAPQDAVSLVYHGAMQRLLVLLGLLIAAIGLLWPWLSRFPIGRLPGDLVIDRPGFKLFAPFTTMIVVSVVLSLIIWLLRR